MHVWHRDGIQLDRTQSTFMRGERSQHCAIPAPFLSYYSFIIHSLFISGIYHCSRQSIKSQLDGSNLYYPLRNLQRLAEDIAIILYKIQTLNSHWDSCLTAD